MAETHRGFFAWLQDNARILLSIALVLFLLFAVYSYSQRSEQSDLTNEDDIQTVASEFDPEAEDDGFAIDEDIADVIAGDGTDLTGAGGGPDDAETLVGTDADPADADAPAETVAITNSATTDKTVEPKVEEQIMEQKAESKDGSIIVAAGNGDGMTHLARRATAEYIQANNIDFLDSAQKIYIEDYLRKSVPAVRVHPGTSLSFTNESIATAVNRAQDLSQTELANLAHYVTHVSAFQ